MRPVAEVTQADINKDGEPEKVTLIDNKARLISSAGTVWQSPESWQVTETEFTDLNHDGVMELTLLVWRPFRPWPVDKWLPDGGRISTFHDARGASCHIVLIGWEDGEFKEVWAGSALAEPVKSFLAYDLDGDGRQELVTLEGLYADSRSTPARFLKVWDWNGFGFSNVSSMDGRFGSLSIAHSNNGQSLILVP